MKVKIRRSNQADLEQVYQLQLKSFPPNDQWYRSNIKQYLDSGVIIACRESGTLIGVLLQGPIIPCNQKYNIDGLNTDYKEDIFEPLNDLGHFFLDESMHFKELYGIVMICVDPDFRGRGLGKKLIEKHWLDNPNKTVCLHTRRSNINAYSLYKSMGYEHIALIKNKYFLPCEDSIFMVKNLTKKN
jgi:ribosomal protein S18 acetylase RimI-like enzyme